MRDTIIKGAGNSRLLKSVPNALTLYPTHEALMQALATSGLPIDLLGLQAAGVEQTGTDLNKATLLSDAAETAIWGNAANRTPDAALKQLRSLIATAQGTADKRVRIETGSYIGDDALSKYLFFSFSPVLVLITGFDGGGYSQADYVATCVAINGQTSIVTSYFKSSYSMTFAGAEWGSKALTITGGYPYATCNKRGQHYYYAALG